MMNEVSPFDRRLQWAVLAAALAFLLAAHAGHGLPFNWDDQGQYLSHARALIEGRPYGDIGFIYTGYNNYIGPVVEPPGVPVLIAPALAIPGLGLLPVRAVMLGSLLVFVWLAWRFVEPLAGRWTAMAVVLLLLGAASQQHMIDGVMSDLPFCAAIWIVIVAANQDGPLDRRRLMVMAIGGAVAFSFRMAALALLPAIALFALFRPRREWPGLILVSVVWAAAGALVMFGLPTSTALVTETSRGAAEVLHDMGVNLNAMRRGIFEAFIYPFRSDLVNDAWHAIAALLAVAGSWRLLRAGPMRFGYAFAIASIAMLVVIPTNASRYWWPLAPLQLLALIMGARAALRLAPAIPPATAVAMAGLIAALGTWRGVGEPAVPFGEREDVIAVTAAMRAMEPSESLRVAIVSPRIFTWHTRIPAMGFFEATPQQTIEELRSNRILFLVQGSLGESAPAAASVDRAIAERPSAFGRVGEFGALTLYRVLPP